MERPDIPRLLGQLEKRGCTIDLALDHGYPGLVVVAEAALGPEWPGSRPG